MADHLLRFNAPPEDLLDRLRPVLDVQGSPPIHARGDNDCVCFTGETGDFMLRARAADALTTVWPDWQQAVRT